MKITKTSDGWLFDAQPGGRSGPRIRKKFQTKSEALEYQIWVVSQVQQGEWRKRPEPSFAYVIEHWHKCSDGLRYLTGRLAQLKRLEAAMPMITPEIWIAYQSTRTKISPATKNRDLAYVRAAYSIAIDHGIATVDPTKGLKMAKVPEAGLRVLTADEIFTVKSGAGEEWEALRLCLATGGRIGEAVGLTVGQVQKDAVRYELTKGGRNRSITIRGQVLREIKNRCEGKNPWDKVYSTTYDKCENLIKRSFTLPKGQSTHVMRHTYAESYLSKGGSLRDLQQILGHASITTTMKYSHFCKTRLAQAAELSPLE